MRWTVLSLGVVVVALACARPQAKTGPVAEHRDAREPSDALYPDVVRARATRNENGTWNFDVTLQSPYDAPERYADAWRVCSADGAELGVRVLTHHHAHEQPFTRSLSGLVIPPDVKSVVIEGRDLLGGWGGTAVEVSLLPDEGNGAMPGEWVGPLFCDPQYLSFGLVRPGQVVSRGFNVYNNMPGLTLSECQIRLAGKEGLEFALEEYFSVHTTPSSDGKSMTVDVTLDGLPENVDGSFQGRVIVNAGPEAKREMIVLFSGVARGA